MGNEGYEGGLMVGAGIFNDTGAAVGDPLCVKRLGRNTKDTMGNEGDEGWLMVGAGIFLDTGADGGDPLCV